MNKYLGIILIVLALAVALIPSFTDCQSQGKAITLANGNTIPMKCHWTARAELALAIPLMAVGAMMVATRRKGHLMILSVMGGLLGIFVILMPNTLIGVCSSSMICNTVMQPSLTILGALAIVASTGSLLLVRERKAKYAVDPSGIQKHPRK